MFYFKSVKTPGVQFITISSPNRGQSSAAQSSVPVTEQGMQPNSWSCFLVMERRGEKGYVCKFLFVMGNLQLCCIQQPLAARTHFKGHSEIYLHSLVTLCLLKGLKKNLCCAGFLLRFLVALAPELLRHREFSPLHPPAVLVPAGVPRTKEHENE